MAHYNCLKCPGYCCSYPVIALNKRDVERLAKYFKLAFNTAKKRFTREGRTAWVKRVAGGAILGIAFV